MPCAERPRARKEWVVCVSMRDVVLQDAQKSLTAQTHSSRFLLSLSLSSHSFLSSHWFYTNRRSCWYVLLNADEHSTHTLISLTQHILFQNNNNNTQYANEYAWKTQMNIWICQGYNCMEYCIPQCIALDLTFHSQCSEWSASDIGHIFCFLCLTFCY